MIRKIIILMCGLVLMAAQTSAKSPEDISSLSALQGVSYVQAQGGLLRSGLQLLQYGIPPSLTQNLTKLQIAVVPVGSSLEEARKEVRRVVNGAEVPLKICNRNTNIIVWGSPDKDDVYKRVVVGIGIPGKVTYILMEGRITGEELSAILSL